MPWLGDAPNLGFTSGDPWLPAGEGHRSLAVDRQDDDPNSMLAFTRRCLELRSSTPALRLGSMKVVESNDQLLRFDREHDGQRLLCTFNLSDRPAPFASSGPAVVTAGEFPAGAIDPFSAIIEDVS